MFIEALRLSTRSADPYLHEALYMSDPFISIVVPTFRRPDALRATLAALLAVDYDLNRYEVIVVDDAAEPATATIVDSLRGPSVPLKLVAQHRLGAASARNHGARLADGALIVFCDDDILVEPSHLRLHVGTRERYGDPVVSGTSDLSPAATEYLRATPFGNYRLELERLYESHVRGAPMPGDPACLRMNWLGSWDLVVRRDLFWQLGGFDEDFPVAGAEDQDFSTRARHAGVLLLLDTNIRCLHNDNRLTLRSYCAREERSAQTMPFLARKHPTEFGNIPYVRENRPVSAADPVGLMFKKLAKRALATSPALASLHQLTVWFEAVHAPQVLLRRLYSGLLGLHLFRGFRRSWRV